MLSRVELKKKNEGEKCVLKAVSNRIGFVDSHSKKKKNLNFWIIYDIFLTNLVKR